MRLHLIMIIILLFASVSRALQLPSQSCQCRVEDLLLSIADYSQDAFCRFGCTLLECVNRCGLTGGDYLQSALDAQCAAHHVIVSVLCLLLPLILLIL